MDIFGMMGKIKEAQSKIQEVQEGLSKLRVSGEAGAGMVKVVATGKREVISIEIEEELLKPEEKDTLQLLLAGAVNAALRNADAIAQAELKKASEGMLPNIPGLDLSAFGLK